jgi:hypothetical protein
MIFVPLGRIKKTFDLRRPLCEFADKEQTVDYRSKLHFVAQ